jgi:uncharacterized protein YaaR (DUF327 family)
LNIPKKAEFVCARFLKDIDCDKVHLTVDKAELVIDAPSGKIEKFYKPFFTRWSKVMENIDKYLKIFTENFDNSKIVQKETFSTVGFPPEISTMSIEEAAIFLKDRVDIAGEDLAFELNDENIEKFKKSVKQFVSFVVKNNFEVTKKNRRGLVSPIGVFSSYNTQPKPREPRIQIQVINEKLDNFVRETLNNQKDNLKILGQVEEIKGLIVDFLSS